MDWWMIGSIYSIFDNTFQKYIYYQYIVRPHIWTLVKLAEKKRNVADDDVGGKKIDMNERESE